MKNAYSEHNLEEEYDQDLFFETVIQEDFDLLHIDFLLQQAFANNNSED